MQGFAPSPADVGDILSIEPNAAIAHEGRKIMIFKDGEFHSSGPMFSVHKESWMDDDDLSLMLIMLNMPKVFSIKDVCLKYEMLLSDEDSDEEFAFKKWGPMLYNKFQRRGIIEKVAKAQWQILVKKLG